MVQIFTCSFNRFEYRDDPVVYENCVVKLGSSRKGRGGRGNHGAAVDDVYAKVLLLRQSVQEVNALLEGGGEERLRDSPGGERVPRQRRQHRSVPRGGGGGCETPLDALIVPPPSTTTTTTTTNLKSHKKAVVSTRVTANISGKYQVRIGVNCLHLQPVYEVNPPV